MYRFEPQISGTGSDRSLNNHHSGKKLKLIMAVVVTLLAEHLLPTSEVTSSNPTIQ